MDDLANQAELHFDLSNSPIGDLKKNLSKNPETSIKNFPFEKFEGSEQFQNFANIRNEYKNLLKI
jgi:hypothetical protein